MVDDMEQDIGGVLTVSQVADLINDQDMRASVSEQGLLQLSFSAGIRKILDEFRGGGAERVEAILDGTIADGDGQVRFSSARLAVQNQRAPLSNEVWSQVGTEQGLTECGLQTEVELVNGLEEGKVSAARTALQAGLLAVRHFFGQQKSQKVAIAPAFFFSSIRHLLVDTPGVRQVQPAEQRLELPFREFQDFQCGLGIVVLNRHGCPPW